MPFEVLDKTREKILQKFGFLRKYGFYLVGGTALALRLRHRTSLDFDFSTQKNFDASRLLKEFQNNMGIENVNLVQVAEGTLILRIKNIETSLFFYDYPLIKPLVPKGDIDLASLEDISAMKIIAIIQRGTVRDFVDIYYLIKKFGLKRILRFAQKKFKNFNWYLALQGLVYFEDADKEPNVKKLKIQEKVNWEDIKDSMRVNVKQLRKEMSRI